MTKINKKIVDEMADALAKMDGVLSVNTSDIAYNQDEELHYYNSVLRVVFDNLSFYGFKLDNFNVHGVNVPASKMNKHLDKSLKKLDDYIVTVSSIQETVKKIKKVVDYGKTPRKPTHFSRGMNWDIKSPQI